MLFRSWLKRPSSWRLLSACVHPRAGLVARRSGTTAMARDNGNGRCFSEGLVERLFFLFLSTFVDFGLIFLAGVLNKVCGGDVPVPCVNWCCTGVSPPLMNILGTALKSGAGKCFVLPDSTSHGRSGRVQRCSVLLSCVSYPTLTPASSTTVIDRAASGLAKGTPSVTSRRTRSRTPRSAQMHLIAMRSRGNVSDVALALGVASGLLALPRMRLSKHRGF